MIAVLLVIALLTTVALVGAGIFFTIRGFRTLNRPPVVVKPEHDSATTAHLKHFFEGKQCAACSLPISLAHDDELRPGLLNANTHEAIAWDYIPAANLSTTLESHVPICPNCLVVETAIGRFATAWGNVPPTAPDLVVDRPRTIENPSH
jgi:hypothetical protein